MCFSINYADIQTWPDTPLPQPPSQGPLRPSDVYLHGGGLDIGAQGCEEGKHTPNLTHNYMEYWRRKSPAMLTCVWVLHGADLSVVRMEGCSPGYMQPHYGV